MLARTFSLLTGSLIMACLVPTAINPTAHADCPLQYLSQWGGQCTTAPMVNNFAYVGIGARFHVLQISGNGQPVPFGDVLMPELIEDIQVAGNFAYVASGQGGLRVINIANAAQPILTNSIDT